MNEEKIVDGNKITLYLTDERLAKIDDFRYARRIPSRAAALRKLFDDGLAANQIAPAGA